MRIIVVHHAKNTNSEKIYLDDCYLSANKELFGAQELDTWGGIRLLKKSHEVWRLEISPNKGVARLVDNLGKQRCMTEITTGFNLSNLGYLKAAIRYLDPTLAQFAHTSVRNFSHQIQDEFDFDLWWSDTQFYHPLIPKGVKKVIRSVNFEPIHVLGEDASFFRFIRFLSKIYSERKVAKNSTLVPISPLDKKRYRRIGIRTEYVLPLRQLPFILNADIEIIDQSQTFIMTGSTFDVRHNRRNLEFVVHKVAPEIQKLNRKLIIKVFGNRMPRITNASANLIFAGFDPDLQKKCLGATGVIVPFHGGAGMQSKIFEPLALGVPVLANPKSLVGFPFRPSVHYRAVRTASEYVQGMIDFIENPDLCATMRNSSISLSRELFNEYIMCQSIEEIISNAKS